MSERERMEVDIIKSLIASYFSIVRKNIGDLVPKTIMHFLVNYAKEHVQSNLVQRLYRDSSLDELLKETDSGTTTKKLLRGARAFASRIGNRQRSERFQQLLRKREITGHVLRI